MRFGTLIPSSGYYTPVMIRIVVKPATTMANTWIGLFEQVYLDFSWENSQQFFPRKTQELS